MIALVSLIRPVHSNPLLGVVTALCVCTYIHVCVYLFHPPYVSVCLSVCLFVQLNGSWRRISKKPPPMLSGREQRGASGSVEMRLVS